MTSATATEREVEQGDGLPDGVPQAETPSEMPLIVVPQAPLVERLLGAYTQRQREGLLLALILLAGAVFRFTGIDWDQGHHLHPDERFLTMVEGALRVASVTRAGPDGPPQFGPAGLLEVYFDASRSALNPHNVGYGFFVYGTFPLFAVRLIAEQLNAAGYDKVHLLGRQLSALSDLVTVALVYLIGRRLYGGRVGLLSAALVAFCVMHIQQAHFFVFDSFLVTLICASFYFCVDVAETGRIRSYALAGLFLGLALATKLSMVVFAPIVALAGLIYLWRAGVRDRGVGPQTLALLWEEGHLRRLLVGGAIAMGVAALMFRVFQPYAFAGPGFFNLQLNPRWLDNIQYQAKSQDGSVDLPPSIQWAGTQPLLFPLKHMVLWGMGLPLGLTAWAGFGAAALAFLIGRRGQVWQHLLLVAWTGLCFVYFASVLNKTMRYLLPMYPFIIILGAWGLVALYDLARRYRDRVRENEQAGQPNRLGGPGQLDRWAEWAPRAALALGAFVVFASVAWSFAFTRIYTRPTTRHAASQWIYQNVPPRSVLANEHWDDPLPMPIPGRDHGMYAGPQLPLYDPDETRKVETLVQMLTQSGYINVTSNRLYGSIPRIPQRYPMATEYYRRLFSGELGFKLVHEESSYPSLGPWVINDDSAEEAFTVYDHPKVLIFQKQPDFSAETIRRLLSAVPLDGVTQTPPIQVGRPNLLMPPDLRAANQAGGTWAEQFSLGGVTNTLAPLLWYLVAQALSLLAAPLLWLGLNRLPDRGYGISKPLGLLFVSWLGWTLAGYRLLPWTRLTLLLSVLALAGASALVLRRHGAAWVAWLRTHRALIFTMEAVFLAAFLLVLAFRAANPDLWHAARGGEKPMEFSYLNAVIRTTYFPPYDPWYAGGYLNYYYFGYVLIAALTKLTGVMPSIGFNVGLATLYALTAVGCFSFAYNLSRLGGPTRFGLRASLVAGVGGFVCLAFLGNLDGFSQLLERLARAGQLGMQSALPGISGLWSFVMGLPAVVLAGKPIEPFDFWRSSRIIPNNTINEFPFWTFLFADLHAHLISIPYQVATLVVLLHVAHGGLRPTPFLTTIPADVGLARWVWRLFGWRRVAEVAFLGWLVGALYVINSWEFPTYLLLTAATLLLAELVAQQGMTLGGLMRAGISAAGVFLLAKPFFRPFWQWYVTFYSSVTPWTQDKSRLDHYLIIHGLLVFGVGTFAFLLGGAAWRHSGWGRYLAARARALSAWDRFSELERTFGIEQRMPSTPYVALIGVMGAFALAFLLRGHALISFLTVLLGLLLAAAWERRDSPALLFAGLLASTGAALGIFVEFFALQGDIGRMNTVFKFYLQTWVLWSLVSAVALTWTAEQLWRLYSAARPVEEPLPTPRVEARIPWWTWSWAGAAAFLLMASLAYPLGATPARLTDRITPLPPTLDGMAYMPYATIEDGNSEVRANNARGAMINGASDFRAIRWLLENAQGTPVILEASVPEYRWGSRVAKYTGLPAVLGWRWHQAQQRGTYAPQVDQRLRDVQIMFNDPSPVRLKPLLDKYGVRYVYVGELERAYFRAAGLAKFEQMPDSLRPVYQADGVTIYQVVSNVP